MTVAEERRIALRTPAAGGGEWLVHALAQLPADARAELPDGPGLRRLAEAYGVGDRMELGGGRAARLSSGGRVAEVEARAQGGAPLGELVQLLTARGAENPVRKGDDGVFAGQRVALVSNLPAPYRTPLFAAMSDRLRAAGADFRVFFGGGGTSERPWIGDAERAGFDHEIGKGTELPIRRRRRPTVTLDLPRRLAAYRPTIVLAGGFSPLMAGRALVYARRRGIPFGVWDGDTPASTPAGRARQRLRRATLARADFAVAYGVAAAEQLRRTAPVPVAIGRNTSPAARPAAGSGNGVALVTVGDLGGPRKGVDIAIDALRLRPALDCSLTIVGGGSGEGALRARAGGDDRIRFTGALPSAEVGPRVAAADVFLFPTRHDVFGLALVEGMGAGLASLTTRVPGVAADLAVDGATCAMVPSHEPRDWAEAIAAVVEDPDRRRSVAEGGAAAVAGRWTVAHAADAMLAGLRLGLLGRTA